MWWPLLNKVEKAKLHGLWKVGYLFANSVLITPACALIIFNNQPLYETYTSLQSWINSLTFMCSTVCYGRFAIIGTRNV